VGGTAVDHHVIPDKTIDAPHDLSAWKLEATVFDGTPSGATVYPGKGNVDGTWSIPNVPAGPYVLHADDGGPYDRFVVTSERLMDLGQTIAGRPDAAKAASDATFLTLQITSVAPATAAFGSIELFSARAGVTGGNGVKMPGGSWTGMPNLHGALLIADDAWIIQSDWFNPAAPDFRVAVGGFAVDPFTMIDGKNTVLTGAVASAPQQSLTATLQQGAFIAAIGNTGGVFPYVYEEVNAIPGDLASGGGLAPALYRNEVTGANKDTPLTLSFGNPFPSSWTVALTVRVGVSIDVKTPKGTVLGDFVWCGVDGAPTSSLGAAIGPELSAPAATAIDGQSGTMYISGGSLTPTVSWENPSLGAASFFVVTVGDGAKPPPRPVLIITTGKSVRIPPGILVAGHEYTVTVTSYSQADPVAKRPFAVSYPRHHADTFAALLAP